MKKASTPKDGDFASQVEGRQVRPDLPEHPAVPAEPKRQTIEDVLVNGEEPTDEFIEEWNEEQNAPDVSDEELARQALSAPGEDGDPNTPE